MFYITTLLFNLLLNLLANSTPYALSSFLYYRPSVLNTYSYFSTVYIRLEYCEIEDGKELGTR